MLLQQKTKIMIWGKATPGHNISVHASWNSSGKAKTGGDSTWSVVLLTPEAGGPYALTISAKDTSILVKNILIGEVWFCSGQSNMGMPLEGWPPDDTVMYSSRTISSASIPEIRLFNVQRKVSVEPLENCNGKWEVSTPATVKSFSATAYFFGKKLYEELHVPIGLIESAWGGTPVESWISSEYLEKSGEFVSELKAVKESPMLQSEYQSRLNKLKQVEVKPGLNDQWKDLSFNDEGIPSSGFNDIEWPVMELPSQFEEVIGKFDGAVWFRKKIEIKQNMAAKDLVLSLGKIDNMDRAYFNGELIGSTEVISKWQIDRNYAVPASLVKIGTNIISVRVLNDKGDGGFSGTIDKMKLSLKKDINVFLPLNGDWKYQPVAELLNNKFFVFDISKNGFQAINRPKFSDPNSPSVLYNAMVNPVLAYKIRGVIWYQGESNVGSADQYSKMFPGMIQTWRDAWNINDFPFYYVQISPWEYSGVDSTESAYLRESQEKALNLVNTGMVTTLDIGTVKSVHPPYKKEVGERLALLALNNEYGIKNQSIGPVYKSMSVEGNSVKLQFINVGDGLVAKNSNLSEFEIAGTDGKFVKANAKIIGNEVLVSAPGVTEPVSVRYCWRNGSEASLFNKAGFPAWQFRTK
jgi:sialate O-acetylesterase